MLAVCTSTQETGSHGESGSVDFYVLKKTPGELSSVAELLDVQSGTFGHSGKVEIVQAGPSFYGFKLEDGWTGQGITLNTTTILLPTNSTIEEAISIRSHLDHSGTGRCDSNEAECSELTRSISFDTNSPNQVVFPLIVVESGILDGKKVNRKFKLPFDKNRWRYRAPKGLVLDLE